MVTECSGKDSTVDNETTPSITPSGGDAHQDETKKIQINVSKDICSVAFLADGNHVLGGGYGGVLRVWQAGDGQEVETLMAMHAGSTVLNIVVSWDGKWVVGGTGNGRVIVWNVENGEKVTEFRGHGDLVRAVDISPDTSRIASGSDDRKACVWSFESGELLLGPLEHDYFLAAVKFSPNGDLLATATWWSESVRIYNVQDGCFLMDIPFRVGSYENQSLAWLPTGDTLILYASSFDGEIKCFVVSTGDVHSHKPLYAGDSTGIRCMVIPSNGKFVAASANSSIFFWNATTYEQIGSVVEHTDIIRSMSISQNYSLATGGGKSITVRSLRDILPSCYLDDMEDADESNAGNISDDWIDLQCLHLSENPSNPHDDLRYSPSDLTNHVRRDGRDPVASGGFADIYRGRLQTNWQFVMVAIKAIRTYSAEDGNFLKKHRRLLREIKIWLRLKHANVLPLLGTATGFGRFPAMVCPWVENGSLTSYLEECHDKLSLVDLLTLLNDAASGLQYLHSRSVVHGDLSGSNVLICKNKRAYITDFGLSTLLTELGGSTFATSVHARGTLRWTAPELLALHEDEAESFEVVPTTHSDVYSFGSVMLQVLTGKVPYHYYVREAQVMHAVSKGMTPRRPSGVLVTERRWEFVRWCWSVGDVPQLRPTGEDLVYFTGIELAEIMTR